MEKIAQLAELQGVDRSTVSRQLIDIGLESGQVLLLLRRPGIRGRTTVERVIRAVAATERVKATQAAAIRVPSVEREVNALRAEEGQAEALAAIHHLQPQGSDPLSFDGRTDAERRVLSRTRFASAASSRSLRSFRR